MPDSRGTPQFYMRQALRLAASSPTLPYPNPKVGCVILRKGRIVGKGFHRGPGSNHAEVEALRNAGARAKGGTLFVTLEPCCHFGRTPPCTDAILQSGIHRVYYALKDPSPLVQGRGACLLRERGVAVYSGVCAREAARLNEVYLKFRATGMPFVTVKVAASLDGKTATRVGESKWITDAKARRQARQLRAEHQAVLVGINTVIADNPHLGVRKRGVPEPWRIILDSHLRIPLESQVVRSGKCVVCCTSGASTAKKRRLEQRGVKVLAFKGRRVPLKPLLRTLAKEGIISLFVEGGSHVLGSFLDLRLVDRVCWFVAPIIIGSSKSRTAVQGRGVARLADAPRLLHPDVTPAGRSWLVRGSLSSFPASSLSGKSPK